MGIRTKLNPIGGKSTKGVFTPKVVCAPGGQCRFIDKKGNLYSSGANDYGQQGSGNTGSVSYLTKRARNVVDVKCSDYTSWYMDINNKLYGCGAGVPQGSGSKDKILIYTKRANNVKDFFVSNGSTWYIDLNNDLYGCGYNSYGQQGTSNIDSDTVLTFAKRASNVIDIPFIQKEYGYTSYYVRTTGLWRCGLNENYQLANGDTINYGVFISNSNDVDGNKAIKIITTKKSTYYLTSTGDLYVTGTQTTNKFGTSAGYYSYYTKIASNVKDFYGSHSTTWYVTNNGDLYGCGYGYSGEQGTDVLSVNRVFNFTKRAENVKCVKCASTDGTSNIVGTTWYLTSDNELYGTGYNGYGQQGSGNTTNVFAFTKRAENVMDFDCTTSSTYYIDLNGELHGCGYMVYTNSTSSYLKTFENLMPYLQS